jgi:hypothetical protein
MNEYTDDPAELLARWRAVLPKLCRGITPERFEAAILRLPLEDQIRFVAALLGRPIPRLAKPIRR